MHLSPPKVTPRLARILAGMLLLAGLSWSASAPRPTGTPQAGENSSEGAGGLDAWAEAIDRDKRISFTRRSAHEAIKVLEDTLSTELERTISLMAVACTEPTPVRQRPVLEVWAKTGSESERKAAILALGEFGTGSDAALQLALESTDTSERACAMWGLLRAGREAALVRVEAIAAGGSEDAPVAAAMLSFHKNPHQPNPPAELEFWAELRWSAATRYGLVDGQTWKTRLLDELLVDERFLEGVVLGSVAEKTQLGVNDHLLTLLLERGTMVRVRAAVVAMPEELGMMIEAGLWNPGGVFGWKTILEEIEANQMESECLSLLSQSLDIPELTVSSLRLLVRAGVTEVLVDLDEQWPELSNQDKILACQAWGMAGPGIAPESMKPFQQEPSPKVQAAVLVTASRLGDTIAHEKLREILSDLEHPEFERTLVAAIAQADSPLIRDYLEQLQDELEGDDQRDVAATLALNGVSSARKLLASHLRDGFPKGAEGVRCIRALALRDAAESVDLFLKHFPVENDLALNIGLARAIVSAQHNSAYSYLRKGLWTGSFDISLLSAAAIVQVGGIHTLRDELNRSPIAATSMDFRRLGFALGEWGGLKEVEHLKTKLGLRVNDPALQGALLGALGRRTH
jgi:hypothetical protein